MGSEEPRSAGRPAGNETAAQPVTVLAGDVGGTNARLALVQVEGAVARIVFERVYRSDRFPGLSPIVADFLDAAPQDDERPVHACFAVAGPVRDGRVRATNLPWLIEESTLASETTIPSIRLINDFSAVALGLDLLDPAGLVVLKEGVPDAEGAIAVMGPGTGLGHGILVGPPARRMALPSEAAHASMAPADEVEWEFIRHMRSLHGHASWERVVSGPGIVTLYQFLAARDTARASSHVREALEAELDPARAITAAALEGTDDVAVDTMRRFTHTLAAQAGNFALAIYATGGVFIAGGIAPRILPLLQTPAFIEAFISKGRLGRLLEKVPVHVVTETRVGLLGAAAMAARTDAIIGSAQA